MPKRSMPTFWPSSMAETFVGDVLQRTRRIGAASGGSDPTPIVDRQGGSCHGWRCLQPATMPRSSRSSVFRVPAMPSRRCLARRSPPIAGRAHGHDGGKRQCRTLGPDYALVHAEVPEAFAMFSTRRSLRRFHLFGDDREITRQQLRQQRTATIGQPDMLRSRV